MPLPDLHVVVQFGAKIPGDAQGKALLAFEKHLRQETGLRVEVFKETKGDDSKLRIKMTPEQRSRL